MLTHVNKNVCYFQTHKHLHKTHKHLHAHTHTQMCIQTQTHVYPLKIHEQTHTHVYIYISPAHNFPHNHALKHTNKHAHTNTYTYIYIYTQTFMQCGGRENSVFSLISHHIATGVVHEPLSGQEHAISGVVYLCTTDSGCVPTPTHFLNHFVVIHWDPYR